MLMSHLPSHPEAQDTPAGLRTLLGPAEKMRLVPSCPSPSPALRALISLLRNPRLLALTYQPLSPAQPLSRSRTWVPFSPVGPSWPG